MNKYLIILIIIIIFTLKVNKSIEKMKAKTYLNTSYTEIKEKVNVFLQDLENVSNEDIKLTKEKANKEKANKEKANKEKEILIKLTNEKLKNEKIANEKAEKLKKEKERLLKLAKQEKNQKEKERLLKLAKEKAREENISKEKAEKERKEKERLIKLAKEKARKEKKRLLKLKLAKEFLANKMIWEEKYYDKTTVIKLIKDILKKANFNKLIISEVDYIIKFINSRKELIKFLPNINNSEKITYNNVTNLVKMINPTNFINIVQKNKNIPVYLKPFNNMIINNFIYHYSPYGVIKYSFRNKKNKDNNMINGVLESTILNDINNFNSKYTPIFNFRGIILQKNDNKLVNLETNKEYDLDNALNKSNYWERSEKFNKIIKKINKKEIKVIEKFSKTGTTVKPVKEVKTVKPVKEVKTVKTVKPVKEVKPVNNKKEKVDIKKMIYIMNKGPKSYIVYPNKVVENDIFSSKINKVIKEHNLNIIGVIPKYDFYKTLKYSNIFLCNDNLYFTVSNNVISQVKDFKKDFKFSIAKEFPKYLSCDDQKILFNQMIKQNIINKETSDKMLTKLNCKV